MTAAPKPEVLAYRALGLGDFLTAVPAYRGLRQAFPDHRLVLATTAGVAPLASLTGAIDDVLVTAELQPLRRRRPRPAVAVDLHGCGPESHRLLDTVEPLHRIGFRRWDAGRPPWPGPEWREDEHESDRWCRMLGDHRILARPDDLGLPVPARAAALGGAVVVHPGAAYGSRRWPAERFAAVAAALDRQVGPVVITGSAAESVLAKEVAAKAGLPPERMLAGSTDVLGLAALVANAALLVSVDTGIAHLATAFGTPSVILFGPVGPSLWGPRTNGPHQTIWHSDQACGYRWAADPDPALLAISADEVVAAASNVLNGYANQPLEWRCPHDCASSAIEITADFLCPKVCSGRSRTSPRGPNSADRPRE